MADWTGACRAVMPDSARFAHDTEPFRLELLAHCYRMLGSIQDAENLVQETYLRAWRSYHGFEGRSSVRTWLYQIATNGCLTELAKRHRRMLPSELCAPQQDPGAYPEQAGTGVSWLKLVPVGLAAPDWVSSRAAIVTRARGTAAPADRQPGAPPAQAARDPGAAGRAGVLGHRGRGDARHHDGVGQKCAAARPCAAEGTGPGAADEIAQPTQAQARALLDQYIAAFENADAAALERLLLEDATIEAPPLRTWFTGRKTRAPFLRNHVLGSPGDWRMLATSANGQPATAAYTRDQHGNYQPYGICVLTLTSHGTRRIVSFGHPCLVAWFGFRLHLPAPGRLTRSAARA